MEITTDANRHSLLLRLGILVGFVWFVITAWPTCGRAEQNSPESSLTNAINEKVAQLTGKPRTIELIAEKAVRVRDAIKQGNYPFAQQLVADVLAESRLQNWRYYPFSDFIEGIINVSDPVLEEHLNEWVAKSKNDAIPLLVRARYYHDTGWFTRGHKFSRQIQAAKLDSFVSYMTKALADIDASVRLYDRNPYSFYLRLRLLRGAGLSHKMQDAFADAIAKFPNYYPLYDVMLQANDPKWGGTIDSMYAFVDRYAGNASEVSPLKLLYLGLYRDLLQHASVACNSYKADKERRANCVASVMQQIVRPNLEKQVQAALRLYDHLDKFQFGIVVQAILSDALTTTGGDVYSSALLEQAAISMHSDTQLKQDKPNHNSYIIDQTVSQSWRLKGFYDNALAKNLEALKDIEGMTFPDEEEKNQAVARIYENIAVVYDRLHQYADMIAYEEAAVALSGGTNYEHLTCYGYYQLKDFQTALLRCTKAITNNSANLKARYWRGLAYLNSSRADEAVADFESVAESEDSFRASAAIEISMVYFNRQDVPNALKALNKYTYLYDPNSVSKTNTAVAYNNRCYAYMQLGDLTKALDDCTSSLQYDSLPDAIRKRGELVKRLMAHETPL